MPISGLIINVEAGSEEQSKNVLSTIPGVEVQEIGVSKLVITTDTNSVEQDQLLTEQISKLDFVNDAQVIFSNMEDCVD